MSLVDEDMLLEDAMDESEDFDTDEFDEDENILDNAVIALDDDKIITGTNVENSSYGLACCAERNALFTAIGQGYKKENIFFNFIIILLSFSFK